MAIYLDDDEKQYLKKLLETSKPQSSFWHHKKILAKVETDIQRVEDMQACQHVFGHYIGAKDCCTKCGGFDEYQGFTWTLDKLLKKEPAE